MPKEQLPLFMMSSILKPVIVSSSLQTEDFVLKIIFLLSREIIELRVNGNLP